MACRGLGKVGTRRVRNRERAVDAMGEAAGRVRKNRVIGTP